MFFYLAVFYRIPDCKDSVAFVFLADSSYRGSVFPGKGFVHTVLHDVVKSVQFRSVVSYRVIVVKPSDLGIVTVKDFKVVIIDKFRPMFGNPLLVPVMIAEFQHTEFQQFLLYHFGRHL